MFVPKTNTTDVLSFLFVSFLLFGVVILIIAGFSCLQAFAKRLVSADRCSLFMFDLKTSELYANLFDEGDEDGSGFKFRSGREIR